MAKSQIALTFDDGPSDATIRMFDGLEEARSPMRGACRF